jgi:hypothetical protein
VAVDRAFVDPEISRARRDGEAAGLPGPTERVYAELCDLAGRAG